MPSSPDQSAAADRSSAEQAPSEGWLIAARAAESKKAVDLRVLDLREVTSFTEYFVICSGTSSRQIQAISDEIQLQLKKSGVRSLGIEGYEHGEWILADYGDFIVHIFSEAARIFYDLERLWRHAREVQLSPS